MAVVVVVVGVVVVVVLVAVVVEVLRYHYYSHYNYSDLLLAIASASRRHLLLPSRVCVVVFKGAIDTLLAPFAAGVEVVARLRLLKHLHGPCD